MKKRCFRALALLLTVCTLLSAFSLTASALSWDGSSSGGNGAGGPAGPNGYAIRTTADNCIGYRFSVVDKGGNNKVSKVIDVFRNTGYGNMAYGSAHKFDKKYNKKQLINNQNSGFSTSKNSSYCYKETSMSFVSKLPAPSGMGAWQKEAGNLNPILSALGVGSIGNLKNGDRVLVEPLYDIRLQSVYHSITVTETALYGKYYLGASSNGGSSGNPESWGFISDYTNKIYPNELYTPDGQGLWSGVSALSKRGTFYDIINKGFGIGIAYTETKPDFTPALSVNLCEAWRGSKSTRSFHYGTSNGSGFGNYSYANGYPIMNDKVWFCINFPAESQNVYVRQSVRLQGGSWTSRNVYSHSGAWYEVALSPTTVDAGRSSYIVEAKVDWIDSSGKVLKYGATKTFYIPIRPKVNRYQVAMYDYSGLTAAKGGSGGYSGAVYVGQKTYPQYTFTGSNTWTSANHLQGSLYAWKSGKWQVANGSADMTANNTGLSKSVTLRRNSTLYPYRVQDNSKNTNGTNRIPFELTSQWTKDTAHTKETTWIDIPIVRADVELLEIRLIDEKGNYITGRDLWAHEKVTPQYVYRNNSSVRIYVEGYDDSKSKFPGVYAADPGKTIIVNGPEKEVGNTGTFSIWGGVYLEGAGRSTSWESNGSNNAWSKSWKVKHPLSIETIAPNSSYREGTEVITSFKVKNASAVQFIPGTKISVRFTAKRGGSTLYSTTKTGVIVPGNNEQLVYFKWTVPSGLNGASITVQGEVLDSSAVVDTASRSVSSGKVTNSQTPDTDYEATKPSGWSQAALPGTSSTKATWSEWIYANGKFEKKTYGLQIAQSTVSLTPDGNSPSAEQVGGEWKIKSGYGVKTSYSPSFTSGGYLYPSSAAYTALQRGHMQLPEFGYSSQAGKYRTLQRSGAIFRFAPNPAAKGAAVHFLPVWYPNGSYQASCYFYDLWTPAGMIAARLSTSRLTVDGSLYDDWYIGR